MRAPNQTPSQTHPKVLPDPPQIPAAVLPVRVTLARQIALEPDAPLSGYFGSRQRERHLAAIQESYGFSDFLTDGYARFRLARWLYALCWSGDDHPGPLI